MTWSRLLRMVVAGSLFLSLWSKEANGQTGSYNPSNGHTYFVSPSGMSFSSARAYAGSFGGYLVAITDAAEQAWIVGTFSTQNQYWIGLTDELVEGQFLWDSGEPFSYANWCPGEPNNEFNEDYVDINMCPGGWNDLPNAGSCCVPVFALVEVPDLQCGQSARYCTGKTNSLGCIPLLTISGTVSASSGAGCMLAASNVLANTPGVYIHSASGGQETTFHAGWLCVLPPIRRHPLVFSAGTMGTCNGVLVEDLNTYIASGAAPELTAGNTVWLQAWSRDPNDVFGDSLSDAACAAICP